MSKLSPRKRRNLAQLVNAGHTPAASAKKYMVHPSTARGWANWGRRRESYVDRPRTGRPPKLLGPKRTAVKLMARAGKTVQQIKSTLATKHALDVSKRTIERAMAKGAAAYKYMSPKRGVVLSKADKEMRKAFCMAEIQKNDQLAVVFTDSKKWYVAAAQLGSRRSWQNPQARVVVNAHPRPTHKPIHAYASISDKGITELLYVTPTPWLQSTSCGITAQAFKALLEPHIVPWASMQSMVLGSGRSVPITPGGTQHSVHVQG